MLRSRLDACRSLAGRSLVTAWSLALLMLLAGCAGGRNYARLDAPRHAGAVTSARAPARPGDTLVVATFNLEFSQRVDEAIAFFRGDSVLRTADVVLLQEMTADAASRIATALGMGWVYYPAIHHFRMRRDVGNAVLARFPIIEDAKLVLPHRSWYARTQRTATRATLDLGDGRALRVYSTHLGTALDIGGAARRAQLAHVLADAASAPLSIVGGDMNDGGVGAVAAAAGWRWPTSRNPRTTRVGRWDHVFVRGLDVPASLASGVVRPPRGVSDHAAVWVRVVVRE